MNTTAVRIRRMSRCSGVSAEVTGADIACLHSLVNLRELSQNPRRLP
jgi:hypothetical protein